MQTLKKYQDLRLIFQFDKKSNSTRKIHNDIYSLNYPKNQKIGIC